MIFLSVFFYQSTNQAKKNRSPSKNFLNVIGNPPKKKPVLGVERGGGQKSMISELLEIFFGSSVDPGLPVGTLISCVKPKFFEFLQCQSWPNGRFLRNFGYNFDFDCKFGGSVPPKYPFFTLEMTSLGFFEVICKNSGMNPLELLRNFDSAKKQAYFVNVESIK